jgi:hypothetical protein
MKSWPGATWMKAWTILGRTLTFRLNRHDIQAYIGLRRRHRPTMIVEAS